MDKLKWQASNISSTTLIKSTPDLLTFAELYSVLPRLYLYVGTKLIDSSSETERYQKDSINITLWLYYATMVQRMFL